MMDIKLGSDCAVIDVKEGRAVLRELVGGDGCGSYQSDYRYPVALGFMGLMALALIAVASMLVRHAVYNCRDRNDCSYVFFVSFSIVPMFSGFLLLALIFGFFPDSPLPHLYLF